jgi:hypothetical protein
MDNVVEAFSLKKILSAECDAKPEMVNCPYCDDVGYTVEPDRHGEPEQMQCEFCYTVPNSVFNVTINVGRLE